MMKNRSDITETNFLIMKNPKQAKQYGKFLLVYIIRYVFLSNILIKVNSELRKNNLFKRFCKSTKVNSANYWTMYCKCKLKEV